MVPKWPVSQQPIGIESSYFEIFHVLYPCTQSKKNQANLRWSPGRHWLSWHGMTQFVCIKDHYHNTDSPSVQLLLLKMCMNVPNSSGCLLSNDLKITIWKPTAKKWDKFLKLKQNSAVVRKNCSVVKNVCSTKTLPYSFYSNPFVISENSCQLKTLGILTWSRSSGNFR